MKRNNLYLLIIVVAGLFIYIPSLFNGFVWDDEEQVVNNLHIRSVTNVPYFFSQSTFNTGGANTMGGMYYKPLMPAFFSFIHAFSGTGAWGYHLVQLVLHILTALLLFRFFKHFFTATISFGMTLIFLVHPGNSEAVLYVSALQDVLFMFFGLLSMEFLMREDLEDRNILLSAVFLFLSVLGKETGFLFVPLSAIYLYFYKRRELGRWMMILSVLVSGYALLRFGLAGIGLKDQDLSPVMRLSFTERLLNIPKVLLFYIGLAFFPLDLAISQHWVVTGLTWTDFWRPVLLVSGFFLAVLSYLFIKRKDQKVLKKWLFFASFLVLGLGLHSQLVPLDMTVAERWFYFPSVGFLGLAGVLVSEYHRTLEKYRQPVMAISALVLVLVSSRTFMRVFDWRDGLTLFTRDERIAAGNFDFENNLGVYLFRAGRLKEARAHYLRSVAVAPHWWTNWNNLAVTYEIGGDLKRAGKYYQKALENGDYYLAYENYANLLLKQKDYVAAKEFLEKEALPKFPNNQRMREAYLYTLSKLKDD